MRIHKDTTAELPFRIKCSDKWGAINSSGETIIPPENDYLSDFEFGHAICSKDGNWGMLNCSGQFTPLPREPGLIINERLVSFSDSLGKLHGLMTCDGEIVVPQIYTRIDQ